MNLRQKVEKYVPLQGPKVEFHYERNPLPVAVQGLFQLKRVIDLE